MQNVKCKIETPQFCILHLHSCRPSNQYICRYERITGFAIQVVGAGIQTDRPIWKKARPGSRTFFDRDSGIRTDQG